MKTVGIVGVNLAAMLECLTHFTKVEKTKNGGLHPRVVLEFIPPKTYIDILKEDKCRWRAL